MTKFSFLPHEPIFFVILRPPTGESSWPDQGTRPACPGFPGQVDSLKPGCSSTHPPLSPKPKTLLWWFFIQKNLPLLAWSSLLHCSPTASLTYTESFSPPIPYPHSFLFFQKIYFARCAEKTAEELKGLREKRESLLLKWSSLFQSIKIYKIHNVYCPSLGQKIVAYCPGNDATGVNSNAQPHCSRSK